MSRARVFISYSHTDETWKDRQLVNRWLATIERDGWRGARRVYGWSFYSQGTEERLTSADAFIDASLRWFGDPDPSRGSARDRRSTAATPWR